MFWTTKQLISFTMVVNGPVFWFNSLCNVVILHIFAVDFHIRKSFSRWIPPFVLHISTIVSICWEKAFKVWVCKTITHCCCCCFLIFKGFALSRLLAVVFLRIWNMQMQPFRGEPRKRCSENMHQIYRRIPRSNCNFQLQNSFIEIGLWHGCSAVNLLHVFRTPFSKNNSGRLLLNMLLINYNENI